jgi:hypothetical protein
MGCVSNWPALASGFTDMVRIGSGLAASSSSLIQRDSAA